MRLDDAYQYDVETYEAMTGTRPLDHTDELALLQDRADREYEKWPARERPPFSSCDGRGHGLRIGAAFLLVDSLARVPVPSPSIGGAGTQLPEAA